MYSTSLNGPVPMPVVIRTRDYGTPASYAELTRGRLPIRRAPVADDEPSTNGASAANGHELDLKDLSIERKRP